MEGWIKLHRKIIEHWIFSNPHYFRAWVIMLFTVNYEPKKVLISGNLIDCDRGQSVLSLESWVDLFGVSKKSGSWTFQKVRTFFDLLEQDGMITKENMIKTTRITICNYNTYQEVQQPSNNQVTTKQQPSNNQVTTTKERKESKELKKEKNKESFDFSFVEVDYSKPFYEWLEYKKENKHTYKTQKSLLAAYQNLKLLSDFDPEKAKRIVFNSIANGWAGLFKLKDDKQAKKDETRNYIVSRIAQVTGNN